MTINSGSFSSMRILLTIMLLAAIYLCNYFVNSLIGMEVSVPSTRFDFPGIAPETRSLGQFTEYRVIAERPLFDTDREPPKALVVEKVVKKKKQTNQLKLQALGIAVTSENLLAVVKDLRTGKTSRLRIDDEIDGWTLTGVSADSFLFAKGEEEKVVKFKTNGE